jgi:cytoskeletal protein CcmA (bactofilin family)
MFTKKPERETGGDSLHKLIERPSSSRSASSESGAPAQERPATYPKTPTSLTQSDKFVPSIIGEDLVITGNVNSKGEIQVDGEIQGDVHCGLLLVGDKSTVTGEVVADDVVVRGKVIGTIRGLKVTLQAQSHVEGDIFHQSLAIEQGAYFEGKSRRADDPLSVSTSGAPSPSRASEESGGGKTKARAAE